MSSIGHGCFAWWLSAPPQEALALTQLRLLQLLAFCDYVYSLRCDQRSSCWLPPVKPGQIWAGAAGGFEEVGIPTVQNQVCLGQALPLVPFPALVV